MAVDKLLSNNYLTLFSMFLWRSYFMRILLFLGFIIFYSHSFAGGEPAYTWTCTTLDDHYRVVIYKPDSWNVWGRKKALSVYDLTKVVFRKIYLAEFDEVGCGPDENWTTCSGYDTPKYKLEIYHRDFEIPPYQGVFFQKYAGEKLDALCSLH